MRLMPRAAMALLAATLLSAPVAAQTSSSAAEIPPVGSVFPGDVVRDLPLGDNVYSLLETTQAEVISDRFSSGGLNVGGDARSGGFLGSWSQTRFRVGDLDVSDPSGSGAPLFFPETVFWQRINVATGLMPIDINTPGLAVTLDPRRGGNAWTTVFTASGAGGGLAAGAPADQPIPMARLKEFAHGSALLSGPLSPRAGLAAGGTWSRGVSYQRERLASTSDTSGSGFAHVVFTASPEREWRALGLVQRSDGPFEYWQPFQDDSATTTSTAVHLQSTLEERPTDGMPWRAFGGFTQRTRTNSFGALNVHIERLVDGPVEPLVAAAADTTARRLAGGARLFPRVARLPMHQVTAGVDLDRSTLENSDRFNDPVMETVDGVPARIWNYSAPSAASNRGVTTVAAFASDVFPLSSSVTLDAAVRAEYVHGKASGAATGVDWLSVLPHAYLRWKMSDRRALVFGYARSANTLNQDWLAFGDPAAPIADVASTAWPKVPFARVGPGTGGNPAFSRIDDGLKRPYTDEITIQYEKRRSERTRYTLTGIARREGNLLGVVNTGVPLSSYSTTAIPDAGKDLTDPSDDRPLIVYNRLPGSFGQDTYLVTNPGQDAATAYALRMSLEHASDRLFLLFAATASAAEGSGGNPGYGPLENDQDVPGALFVNPNANSYARGRLFSDRAFTIKWTTVYRFPHDITAGAIARYQDGQPFSRMVVVSGPYQGVEAIQAYPNGGSRFTFTGTLDLRVQKGFRFAGGRRVDAFLDAYNLFTRNNEVEEYVVSGSLFRTPTAIQPPASVHVGVRVSF